MPIYLVMLCVHKGLPFPPPVHPREYCSGISPIRCCYCCCCRRHPAVWTLQDDEHKDSPASALTSPAWEYPWLPSSAGEGAGAGAGEGEGAAAELMGAAEAEPMSSMASGAAEGAAAKGEEAVEHQGSPAAAAAPAAEGADGVERSVEILYGSRATEGGGGCCSSAADGGAGDDPADDASREGGGGRWWAGLGETHPWLPIPEAEAAALLPT